MSDHLWGGRWLLQLIAEKYNVIVSFDAKRSSILIFEDADLDSRSNSSLSGMGGGPRSAASRAGLGLSPCELPLPEATARSPCASPRSCPSAAMRSSL